MIDPTSVICYNRNPWELEEFLMFCILVAGKNAKTTARLQEELLNYCQLHQKRKMGPFELIYETFKFSKQNSVFVLPSLACKMKGIGFGCYNLKAKSLWMMAERIHEGLDISKCSVEDLESVIGIGPKTARFFLVFSRPDQNDIAVLDTHVLRFLREEHNVECPMQTPSGRKYKEIESKYVEIVKKSGMTMAQYDLNIWKIYSQNKKRIS